MFWNNYELSVNEKLTAIKYWSRMNELNVSIENIPGKVKSYQKMINLEQVKQKHVYFVTFLSIGSFYLSYPFRKPPEWD